MDSSPKKRGRPRIDVNVTEILRLQGEDYSIQEIADELGYTKGTVYKRLQEHAAPVAQATADNPPGTEPEQYPGQPSSVLIPPPPDAVAPEATSTPNTVDEPPTPAPGSGDTRSTEIVSERSETEPKSEETPPPVAVENAA